MFKTAERTLNTMCKIKNFLYGGTKRLSTRIKSFMLTKIETHPFARPQKGCVYSDKKLLHAK